MSPSSTAVSSSAITPSTFSELRQHFDRHNRVRSFELASSSSRSQSATINSLAWNCDGRRLATASSDAHLVVAKFDGSRLTEQVPDYIGSNHKETIDQVCWHQTHPDQLVTAAADKSVRVWDARTRKCTHNFVTKYANLNVTWSPDGNAIGYSDKGDRVTVLDTRTWKTAFTKDFKTETNELCWEPNTRYLFIATGQGLVQIFNTTGSSMHLHCQLKAHPVQCVCNTIRMSPKGTYFAVGGSDAVVSVWDLNNLVCLRTINRLEYSIRQVSFSHDESMLAAGSEDPFIDISYTKNAQRITELKGDADTYSLSWNPKHPILAFTTNAPHSRDREPGAVKLFGLTD